MYRLATNRTKTFTAVKISVLCAISAFERSLM